MNTIEIIGYTASSFVVISFLMVSIVKLRILSLIGATFFSIYGFLVGSVPIIITNGFVVAVQIYFLLRIFRFDTSAIVYLRIGEKRRQTLLDYIHVWKMDIIKFYSLFSLPKLDYAFEGMGKVFLALKKSKPIGFAFYTRLPEEAAINDPHEKEIIRYVHQELYPGQTGYLHVDYVSPKYRDIGLVNKLYSELTVGLGKEIKYLMAIIEIRNRKTHGFLLKNGYTQLKRFSRYALYTKEVG